MRLAAYKTFGKSAPEEQLCQLTPYVVVPTCPAGDPIEMGAAAAVMFTSQQQGRQQPLLAAAGKSWIGHTEAAAGAMGIIHSLLGLGHRSAQALLHLSAVNPYLEASLRPQGMQGEAAGWSLPRQAAGLPCAAGGSLGGSSSGSLLAKLGSASALATGISSFAFQVRLLLQLLPSCVVQTPRACGVGQACGKQFKCTLSFDIHHCVVGHAASAVTGYECAPDPGGTCYSSTQLSPGHHCRATAVLADHPHLAPAPSSPNPGLSQHAQQEQGCVQLPA